MYRMALLAERTKYNLLKCNERVFDIFMFKMQIQYKLH